MAAVPAELRQEIASVERSLWPVVYGGVMCPNDDTLATRGGPLGLRIYDDIERDCHAYAVLQKRRMAVVSREWSVDPASTRRQDRKAAEMVADALRAMDFDQACLGLLDAVLKGFAVGEVMWGMSGGLVVPQEIRVRDQRRFAFDVESKLRLLVPEAAWSGIELPDRKFIVHRFGAKDGNPYGLGLGTRLFWPALFKRRGITFWLIFTDKFASPTAKGTYDPQTHDVNQQTKLLAALNAISTDAGIAIPTGMEIELLEAARTGSVDAYDRLVRYLDEQISEAVLGETLTTNLRGGGSLAASQTHNEVRLELVRADADLLAASLNGSLIRWLVDLNMPGVAYPTLSWDFSEPEDLLVRAQRDQAILSLGFVPTPGYIARTYGDGFRPVVAVTPPSSQGGDAEGDATPAPSFAAPTDATPPPDADALAALVADADRLSGPVYDRTVAALQKLAEQCGSLDELLGRLTELYPEIDADQLARVMEGATTAANLTGRASVLAGAGA